MPARKTPADTLDVIEWTIEERAGLSALLADSRWAALATVREDSPLASWVAVVPEGNGRYLLHLSRLAAHTRNLQTNPRASLTFSEPDQDPSRDPQTLVRISLQGQIHPLDREANDYRAARERYLAWLPAAQIQFTLGDFQLMRFVPESARSVTGFGSARRLTISDLETMFTTST